MMAKVEGMPLAALEQGVPWSWDDLRASTSTALEGNVGVNAGVPRRALRAAPRT